MKRCADWVKSVDFDGYHFQIARHKGSVALTNSIVSLIAWFLRQHPIPILEVLFRLLGIEFIGTDGTLQRI